MAELNSDICSRRGEIQRSGIKFGRFGMGSGVTGFVGAPDQPRCGTPLTEESG
jgi:hypothetical protein